MKDNSAWEERDIESAAQELAAKNFGKAIAYKVKINPDTDHDGDPILRIMVVLEPVPVVKPENMLDFILDLRERLIAHNVDDFPIVSYVSKAEFDQRARGSH